MIADIHKWKGSLWVELVEGDALRARHAFELLIPARRARRGCYRGSYCRLEREVLAHEGCSEEAPTRKSWVDITRRGEDFIVEVVKRSKLGKSNEKRPPLESAIGAVLGTPRTTRRVASSFTVDSDGVAYLGMETLDGRPTASRVDIGTLIAA